MKILVTGSEGFIGSKLCKALEELGHQISKIDRKLQRTIESSNPWGIDLIFHLAAQTDVQYSREHPFEDAMDNIMSTIRLIQKYPGVKIIYPASAASLEINSPYGLSKRVAMEYIKLLCPEYVICTLGNIWGDGGHGAIDKFFEAEVIKVNGDGHQTRSIIHVQDVVKGFIKAMEWPTGEYSLGNDAISIKQIAERISEKTGKPIEYDLSYDPVKQGEVYAAVLPNTTPDWHPEVVL